MLLMILVGDIGGAIYTKAYYQGGIDFCCKSAAMEIARDDDYAKGIISIDNDKAKKEFANMMISQFNKLNEQEIDEGTVYAQAVNTVPSVFIHPVTGKEYMINEPMFVAVFRVKRKGVFINQDILVDNLSGNKVSMKP